MIAKENIVVTEADVQDVPAMSAILCSLAVATHEIPGETERNNLVREHFVRKAGKLATEIETGYSKYWIAEDDGERVLGMGGYNPAKQQLHSLYVPQKGRGIGTRIFEHIISRPEVVANYSAWIADINAESFAFFGRRGLERTGNTDIWRLGDGSRYSITIHQVTPNGLPPSLTTVK